MQAMQRRDRHSLETGTSGHQVARCLTLPVDIWICILDHLVPRSHPNATTFPNLAQMNATCTDEVPTWNVQDLLSLALTCKTLEPLIRQRIYRVPILANVDAARAFVNAGSNVSLVRAIHIPHCPQLRLDKFFALGSGIDHLSLEIGSGSAYLSDFLGSASQTFPSRLTILQKDGAEPNLSGTLSLQQLSRVSHLHLINATPQLVSLLVGVPIRVHRPDDPHNIREVIEGNLTPRTSLECLRLSSVSPIAMFDFCDYAKWRVDIEPRLGLPLEHRVEQREPLCPCPSGPLENLEVLFGFIINAGKLPRLRLLILEMDPLTRLSPPRNSTDARYWVLNRMYVLRKQSPADKDLSRATCRHLPWFNAAIRREMIMRPNSFGPPIDPNEDRLLNYYDLAWTEVQLGKGDLGILCRHYRRAEAYHALRVGGDRLNCYDKFSDNVEIRVVAPRERKWDSHEMLQELQCQVDNVIFRDHSRLDDPALPSGVRRLLEGSLSTYAGCWADPDAFSLIAAAPWLSYREVEQSDGRPDYCHWTGCLPRHAYTEVSIPSSITLPRGIKDYRIPFFVDLGPEGLDDQGKKELAELNRGGSHAPHGTGQN
ncbi:uncharacterized protein UTRI_02684 [Ustilago trichophora]|uniref:Uncharacterized protein n=1 Tax=Ustilago trichophora TaxID=86804 RepID=A0A5C3EQQ5_9BASI|nr:uncharacterized protein UTRI_02684 [Ustilago trichophora]